MSFKTSDNACQGLLIRHYRFDLYRHIVFDVTPTNNFQYQSLFVDTGHVTVKIKGKVKIKVKIKGKMLKLQIIRNTT